MSAEQDVNEGRARVNPATGEVYGTTSWAAVDLEPFKRGEQVIAPPRFLLRDDGRALIYPRLPHVFYGESESLKTWAALLACRSVVDLGLRALYVDLEGSEASFVERARMVGVPEGAIGSDLRYVRPTAALGGDARVDFWHHELDLFGPSLVVLDGVTELYALQGWDVNKAEHAALFQGTFAFQRGGVASIAIDHTSKDAGRGQLGSQHKRAGLDGAEFLFEPMVAAGRGRRGMARVRVSKDRHGFIREWAADEVGKIIVDDAPDAAAVYLERPKLSDLIDPKDDAMNRVLAVLREHPGASGRKVTEESGMRDERVRGALRTLEALGKVSNLGPNRRRGAWWLTS